MGFIVEKSAEICLSSDIAINRPALRSSDQRHDIQKFDIFNKIIAPKIFEQIAPKIFEQSYSNFKLFSQHPFACLMNNSATNNFQFLVPNNHNIHLNIEHKLVDKTLQNEI